MADTLGLDHVQPLQIGDTIPEALWHLPLQVVNHPEGKDTITLNDYRGKLIILDFWATWCGVCIDRFPGLFALHDRCSSSLQVLLVNTRSTRDTAEMVRFFYKDHANLFANRAIPSIVDDLILDKLFPHRFIPHYVWIGTDGIIREITGSLEESDARTERFLEGIDVK